MKKGSSVLLVEDDHDQRVVVSSVLALRHHKVKTAENGLQALDALGDGYFPDVIVMDLNMEEMDGWQLRQHLLNDERYFSIPVVIVSGAEPTQRDEKLQAFARLRKPVNVTALFRVIDACSAQEA